VLVGLKIITILLHAEDALQKLQEKHPPASGRLDDLPDINPESALSVTEIEVRQAVLSFPAGSSGGPDGMRPQHLKDMMQCRESGTDFLAALTGFTNVVLAGLCPKEATLFFFGGRLLAMNKKSGGIGLIAVGVTLRRLASNVAILTARHAWLLVWPSTARSRHSRGTARQPSTLLAVTFKVWPCISWSNSILPTPSTVCMAHAVVRDRLPASCMRFASYRTHSHYVVRQDAQLSLRDRAMRRVN